MSYVLRTHSWPAVEPGLESGKSGSSLREAWLFQAESVSGLAGICGIARAETPKLQVGGYPAQGGSKGKLTNETEI